VLCSLGTGLYELISSPTLYSTLLEQHTVGVLQAGVGLETSGPRPELLVADSTEHCLSTRLDSTPSWAWSRCGLRVAVIGCGLPVPLPTSTCRLRRKGGNHSHFLLSLQGTRGGLLAVDEDSDLCGAPCSYESVKLVCKGQSAATGSVTRLLESERERDCQPPTLRESDDDSTIAASAGEEQQRHL
jgi:hypothetical protein